MSNILTANVKIVGTRPLLQHHFGADALPLEKKEKTGVAGNNPEEWRSTAMVTKDGQLYLEPTYIFATLRDGARYTKKGRGSIQSLVTATLQVTDDVILIDRYFVGFPNGHSFDVKIAEPPSPDKSAPVFLDITSVRNPSTKGRNLRYRVGASKGWEASFNIMWDKTVVDRKQMNAVIIDAGLFCGLGDGRSIGYGRFEVKEFSVSDRD